MIKCICCERGSEDWNGHHEPECPYSRRDHGCRTVGELRTLLQAFRDDAEIVLTACYGATGSILRVRLVDEHDYGIHHSAVVFDTDIMTG
jgi:hypothetical protein